MKRKDVDITKETPPSPCEVNSEPIPLEDLRVLTNRNLSEQLRAHCFAVVRVPSGHRFHELTETLERRVVELFAGTSDADKRKQWQASAYELGYKLQPGIKETVFIRLRTSPQDMPPELAFLAELRDDLIEYYNIMRGISLDVLRSLEAAQGVTSGTYTRMTQPPDGVSPQDLDTSSVRLFQYFNLPDTAAKPCADHNDLGLLALVPSAATSGLQVFSFCSGDRCPCGGWVDVERLHRKGDIVVMAGETLSRMTGEAYFAAIHQVERNTVPRISLPFLLRGRDEAWLAPAGRLKGTTVKDFMDDERRMRTSVNDLY
eukprot:TRINITY_DN31544_c0_g1_i1.p1 TRINITY_DN31544_c0_g1~~TRINITY_DN31544_c0_g1_i1.p1  ORF type:complete len:316 (-),score=76.72 TRINITY_DN31544_c0_g1_i1:184-1131(-)